MSKWCLINSGSQADLKELYGEQAVVSQVGQFRLIHLDSPTPEEVARRVAEFDPSELFEDDCPICQMLKAEPCDVIYEGEQQEEQAEE